MAANAGNSLNKLVQTSIVGNNILAKVEAIATENAETLKVVKEDVSEMRSSITVIKDLLTTQNKILLEIKSAIQMSGAGAGATSTAVGGLDAAGAGAAGGGPTLPPMNIAGNLSIDASKNGGAGGAGSFGSIIAMAGAVALAATILGLISVTTPTEMLMKFGVALATVGVLMLIAPAFTNIMKILSTMKISVSEEISGGFEGMELGLGMSGQGSDIVGMMAAAGGAFVSLILMSTAIVASSHILRLTYGEMDLIPKLGMAILISLALAPMALGFGFVLNALSGMKKEASGSATAGLIGGSFSSSSSDIMGMIAAVGGAFVSLIAMSVAIVASSYILAGMPSDESLIEKAMVAGVVSLAMIPLAFAFGMLLKAMSFAGPNPATAAIMVAGAAIALPLMMGGLGLGIRALNLTMPDTYPMLPEWEWLAKFSLIALIAGVVFYAVGQVVKGMGFKDLVIAGLAIPVAFGGLALGVRAWSMFAPDASAYANPMDPIWAWKMGLSLLAFTLPMFVLGKLGLPGVIAGALGLTLLMGAIGAGLWLFDFAAPDDPVGVANTIATSVLQPFYAVIDLVKYFIDQIPIDQAGAIGMALLKVGAGYAAFTLAVQGSSGIGSVLGGALNFVGNIFDGLSKALGGEAQQKATDILIILANNADKLRNLGKPLKEIGAGFAAIAMANQPALEKARKFLKDLDSYNFNKQAAQLERIATSFNSISDATNKMNIEAINSTNELFKTINESISSGSQNSINDLRDMLVDILDGMAAASRAMTGSGNAFTQGVAKIIDKVKGEGEQAGEAGGSGDIQNTQQLVSALKDLQDTLSGTLPVYVTNQSGY